MSNKIWLFTWKILSNKSHWTQHYCVAYLLWSVTFKQISECSEWPDSTRGQQQQLWHSISAGGAAASLKTICHTTWHLRQKPTVVQKMTRRLVRASARDKPQSQWRADGPVGGRKVYITCFHLWCTFTRFCETTKPCWHQMISMYWVPHWDTSVVQLASSQGSDTEHLIWWSHVDVIVHNLMWVCKATFLMLARCLRPWGSTATRTRDSGRQSCWGEKRDWLAACHFAP